MLSIIEMAEAHLVNVKRELASLNETRLSVEKEIEKFTMYLKEGEATLLDYRSQAQAQQPNLVGQADILKVGSNVRPV
jgi:septal ring factor EnvC (AmiA/AmiB activator)